MKQLLGLKGSGKNQVKVFFLASSSSLASRNVRTNCAELKKKSVLQAFFVADYLQLQGHLFGHAVRMHREDLALSHRDVLLGEQKSQKARNDPSIEGRTGAANPVDLNSRSELSCGGKNHKLRASHHFSSTRAGPSTVVGFQISLRRVHGRPGVLKTEIHTHVASVHRR